MARLGEGRLPNKINPRVLPIRSPGIATIYWAAGFYEGEGSCSVLTDGVRGYKTMVVSMTQKDPQVLLMLRDYFGGTIYSDRGVSKLVMRGAIGRGFVMTIFKLLSTRRKKQIMIGLLEDGQD